MFWLKSCEEWQFSLYVYSNELFLCCLLLICLLFALGPYLIKSWVPIGSLFLSSHQVLLSFGHSAMGSMICIHTSHIKHFSPSLDPFPTDVLVNNPTNCFLPKMQNKFLVSHFLSWTRVKVNSNHVFTTNWKLAEKKWTTTMQQGRLSRNALISRWLVND